MPLDQLPAALVTPSRDQLVQRFLRDWLIRSPNSRPDPGGEPYMKAQIYADQAMPQFANAVLISRNTSRATMTGIALDNEATSLGTQRFPPVGASGAAQIGASAGGVTIYQGDVAVIGSNLYQCTATALYLPNAQVPITGISTGVGTDQDPGTIGFWQVPRPGCNPSFTVVAQVDGSGLSDGADLESDDDLRQRLDELAANPPASGNDAEIIALAGQCPGLSIQQAFTFPCIQGPGTTCVVFTLRSSNAGGNRIPNPAQVAMMAAWIQGPGQMPADPSITVGTVVAQPVGIVLRPTWADGAPSWTDSAPWPTFTLPGSEPQVGNFGGVVGANTSTTFRVLNATTTPSVGQDVAVFDQPNLTFRRKQILSFTTPGAWLGTHTYALGAQVAAQASNGITYVFTATVGGTTLSSAPTWPTTLGGTVIDGTVTWTNAGAPFYDITVSTQNNVSDTSYTPLATTPQGGGQYVCPWSESLNTLVPAMVAYFASFGPGEQVIPSLQVDPGSRLRRIPKSPAFYPSIVNHRITSGPTSAPFVPYGTTPPAQVPTLDNCTSLNDVAVLDVGQAGPSLPFATTVGSPGVSAFLLVFGDYAAFP